MISNDTNINTCDNITATSKDMVVSDENSNSSCSTTIPTTIIKTTSTIVNQINNDNKNSRDLMLKHGGDSFTCDISLMSCYSSLDEENDDDSENEQKRQKQQPQEEEEGVEEDDGDEEIYYESTNENDRDFQQENIAPERSDTESEVDDCGLSKLYLNDIEINDKEEEQTITELVNVTEKDKLMQVEQNKSMRVAFGIILRLIFPLANGVVQGIKGIRDVRFLRVLRNIASSRQALTNLFAFAANTISMNLSSVQVTHRIEPILKLLKIRKSRDGIESLPDSPSITETLTPSGTPNPTSPTFSPFCREPRYSLPNFQTNVRKISFEEQVAEKCCTINILAEPPPGEPIRADIVFIHGLHGSLVNTWRQGLWENERRPVEFERPPKPDVRPPKRPRNSRSTVAQPLHHQKRARFGHNDVHQKHSKEKDSIDEAEDNSYSFICGEPKDIQVCDDIEYSFPTFRLRLNDNGRLLQAEHDSKQHGAKKQTTENTESENSEKPNDKTEQSKKPKAAKLTRDDPNYSRCWPGDWLPLDCPGVRVIAVNYTTDPHLWRPLWKKKEARSNLIQRSREMAELLIKHRVGYGHPIVWVGHSKGGLFIKQMIVDAWESGRPAAAPFWRSARGVFFYSVPHRGSHLASIKAPLLLRSVELIDIEKNNKYLLDLHRRFAGLYHLGHLKIEVFSFVETALTLMSVLYMRIVGVDSADPGIGDVCGIRLDHREICKPRDRDCILYKQLVNMINKVC